MVFMGTQLDQGGRMRFTDKFVRTVENALHWKSSPSDDRHADRQNTPPDERDAEFAEERAANEFMDGDYDADALEHELVSSSGARPKSGQNKS
jgi:hypothetical protein